MQNNEAPSNISACCHRASCKFLCNAMYNVKRREKIFVIKLHWRHWTHWKPSLGYTSFTQVQLPFTCTSFTSHSVLINILLLKYTSSHFCTKRISHQIFLLSVIYCLLEQTIRFTFASHKLCWLCTKCKINWESNKDRKSDSWIHIHDIGLMYSENLLTSVDV